MSDCDAARMLMPPALFEHFQVIYMKLSDVRETNIRFYYQVGQICMEIAEHPEKYIGTDGTPGMNLLERSLGTDARHLRNCRRFAEEITADDLDRLLQMRNDNTKYQLNYGHVPILLTVDDPARRMAYAEDAVNGSLPPEALHDIIKKDNGGPKRGGRPHQAPASLALTLYQMQKAGKTWLDKYDQVWNGDSDSNIFQNICSASAEELTDDLMENLGKLRLDLEALSVQAAEAADLALQSHRHAYKRLHGGEELPEDDEPDSDEEEE